MEYKIIKADTLKNLTRFKKFGGEAIADIKEYVREYIKLNPNTQVSVGCDSQQMRRTTAYAVVIVFYNPLMRSGAHIVFARENVKKNRDIFSRLYGEVEVSHYIAEIVNEALVEAEYVRVYFKYRTGFKYGDLMVEYTPEDTDKYFKLLDIHLDLNPEPGANGQNKSNMVHDLGKSMIESLGFRCLTKPMAVAASCAADLISK